MILLFAVICGVLAWFLLMRGLDGKSVMGWIKTITAAILMAGVFFGVIVGFFIPFGGYEEPVLTESYEITSCVIDGKEVYAIDNNGECIILTKVKERTAYGEVSFIDVESLEENYVIIPEENCQMPRFEKYLKVGKGSIWSLAKEQDVETYKIYVPTGTIYLSN